MQLEILDKDFVVTDIVDNFESLIWTERYRECGDFELYTSANDPSIQHTVKAEIGYYLRLDSSDNLMIVEKYAIDTDVENGNKITLSGRSLESLLMRRIVWKQTAHNGDFQNGIKKLLDENVISPSKSERAIPRFIFERTNDPYIENLTVDFQFTGDNLYDAIKSLCDAVDVGFRITLNDSNQMVFKLYYGADRSYDQTVNPYVIFSPSYDNIITSNYYEENTQLRTVSLVAGEDKDESRRTAISGDDTISGFDRFELYTDARDIQSEIDLFNGGAVTVMENHGYIEAGTKKVQQASTTRSFWVRCKANSAYSIRRSYDYRDILSPDGFRVASATVQPAIGSNLTTVVVSEDAYSLEITTGANDTYLMVQLFNDSDVSGAGATYSNTISELSVQGSMPDADYDAQLIERGLEKLAGSRYIQSFEAEIEPYSSFKYGKDYFIGDVLQIENEYGIEAKTRVIEVVKSQSSTGYEEYPTFETIFDEEE